MSEEGSFVLVSSDQCRGCKALARHGSIDLLCEWHYWGDVKDRAIEQLRRAEQMLEVLGPCPWNSNKSP